MGRVRPNKGRPMTDDRDLSEGLDPAVTEEAEKRRVAEKQAFADKLAKRSPPDAAQAPEPNSAREDFRLATATTLVADLYATLPLELRMAAALFANAGKIGSRSMIAHK